jgi:hypothetical protein
MNALQLALENDVGHWRKETLGDPIGDIVAPPARDLLKPIAADSLNDRLYVGETPNLLHWRKIYR